MPTSDVVIAIISFFIGGLFGIGLMKRKLRDYLVLPRSKKQVNSSLNDG